MALSQESTNSEPDITVMPPLGNKANEDRLMLREVSDQHVHNPAKSVEQASGLASSSSQSSVWELVRDSNRLSIPNHPTIARYRKQYAEEAFWVSRIFERADPYIGFIVAELDKRYLPLELALLPAIESGYQADVRSSQEALGIWQIVPSTASDIGLNISQWFDGRADVVDSTRAAADYLSYLNAEFNGDWTLTLAAYNAGLGRVRTAVKRNNAAGKPTDFWSLNLPTETKNYVPKFLALVAMLRYDRPENFRIPVLSQGSAFSALDSPSRISLDKLAQIAELPIEQILQLNSGLKRMVTPPDGPHRVYVPIAYSEVLIQRIAKLGVSKLFSNPEFHTVSAGDNLSTLAQRYGVAQKRIMQLNQLDSAVIKIGQKLRIMPPEGESGRIDYVVTIGDTLSQIAQKFSVKVQDIRDEQGQRLKGDVIHPGVRLSLPIE